MIIEIHMATHVYNVYVASRTIIIAVEYMEIKKVYQIVYWTQIYVNKIMWDWKLQACV